MLMMSHAFALRPAQAEDEPAIKRLIRETRLNPMGLKWPHFVVAEDEQGRFIGCGQVKRHRDGTRELASIAVVKAYRGRNVASAIIQHLLNGATRPLYLMCGSRLVPFYQKFGFRELTTPAAMPPLFRRFRRLAKIMTFLSRSSESLAVMVLEA